MLTQENGVRIEGCSGRRVVGLAALAMLIALVALAPAARAQDVISLRPHVRVETDRMLTLSDIAELTGDAARSLGSTEVGRAGEIHQITLSAVREKLERNRSANFGRIRVCGSACTVEVGAIEPAPAPVKASSEAPTPAAGPDSIRRHVENRIADLLGVGSSRLKLSFSDADAALLATAVGARTLSIQPSGAGDRLPLNIRVYDGDSLALSGTVRVGVLVQRPVLVALAPLARGTVLDESMVSRDEQWLPPSVTPADPDSALGQEIRSRVSAGEVLRSVDVEAPMVVKKGDLVVVDCVSGGFVVRTTARATENGREGQIITLQSTKSKSTFKARMAKDGLAVTVAPAQGPETREGT